jgi:curved DNA-binding protein CbpA
MRADQDVFGLDLFALLDLAPGARPDEVRAAYRRKARQSHPDLNPSDPDAVNRMATLNRAARVLLDPALRAAYERTRARSDPKAGPRQWYEREAERNADWSAPERPREAPAGPAARAFRRRVRPSSAEFATRAAAFFRDLERDQCLMLAVLCVALGSALLAWSEPVNAFWSSSERQLSPYVETPAP